ncbi:DeoR family transcriptional regulator [Bacilli bacterium]|nr:DeoR family transcriptional regulator [Bacilli bacterium]GHU41444.1 DeoR family transcriptional regulator [Bacilli bacterium]
MSDWRENRIEAAQRGENPMVMVEMPSGFACIGDTQFLVGYCVLLPKREVFSLNDLTLAERSQFLTDMSVIGDALLAETDCLRINYDILGNTDNYLHAHIFPRYLSEAPERLKKPVWLYDASYWFDDAYAYDENKHGELRSKLTAYLKDFEQTKGHE